jgi:hypothetical protein
VVLNCLHTRSLSLSLNFTTYMYSFILEKLGLATKVMYTLRADCLLHLFWSMSACVLWNFFTKLLTWSNNWTIIGQSAFKNHGCRMVCFQTNPPVSLHFGSPLNWNFWYLLWPFGILCGHLLYFMEIWYTYVVAICYIIHILVYYIIKSLVTLLIMSTYVSVACYTLTFIPTR